jgi:hypothetical protein
MVPKSPLTVPTSIVLRHFRLSTICSLKHISIIRIPILILSPTLPSKAPRSLPFPLSDLTLNAHPALLQPFHLLPAPLFLKCPLSLLLQSSCALLVLFLLLLKSPLLQPRHFCVEMTHLVYGSEFSALCCSGCKSGVMSGDGSPNIVVPPLCTSVLRWNVDGGEKRGGSASWSEVR